MSRRPLTSAGRAHLKKRMLALPEQMRRYADESLSKSADELVDAIKAAAPKGPTGDLAASIKKEPLGEGRIGYRVVGGERGKGKKGWYIRFVEFGTKASPGEAPRQNRNFKRTRVMTKGKRAHAATRAQPFFWPTFRRSRSRIRSRTTRALKKGAIREKVSLSVDVTGSGKVHKPDVKKFVDWQQSPNPKNCIVVLDDEDPANVIQFEGAYHLTTFSMGGDPGAPSVTGDIALQSSGAVESTYGANVGGA